LAEQYYRYNEKKGFGKVKVHFFQFVHRYRTKPTDKLEEIIAVYQLIPNFPKLFNNCLGNRFEKMDELILVLKLKSALKKRTTAVRSHETYDIHLCLRQAGDRLLENIPIL
jgi:hypothetical protein